MHFFAFVVDLIKLGVVRGKFGSAVGSEHSHNNNPPLSTLAKLQSWHDKCNANVMPTTEGVLNLVGYEVIKLLHNRLDELKFVRHG